MSKKLWGGRFKKKTDPLVEKFTSSINVDYRLAECDAIGSKIQAFVLAQSGIISQKEKAAILKELDVIIREAKSGRFSFDSASEDIHTEIQARLKKRAGKAALKLQTARSRNGQTAFDTRLYCKKALSELNSSVEGLGKAIAEFADSRAVKGTVIPGYTHMQHAQPVALAEYFKAYAAMLGRDSKRFADIGKRLKISVGSGALAGTPIELSKYSSAIRKVFGEKGLKELSIEPADSTIDVVSDRDFVIETLGAIAILGMHLSRLAEDFIVFSSAEFGFIEIGDEFCTGSSLMPNKKNPDVLELIRSNTGKLYGNLTSVLVMMKGLPLAYNRDMQLDKEPLFGSIDIIEDEIEILAGLIKTIKINKNNIARQLEDEGLYATDLAFYLARKGVAFEKAHDIVGRLIRYSLDNGIKIKEMPDTQLKKFSAYLNTKAVNKIFDPLHSIRSKRSFKRR